MGAGFINLGTFMSGCFSSNWSRYPICCLPHHRPFGTIPCSHSWNTIQ